MNDFIPPAPAEDFFQRLTAMPGNQPRCFGIIGGKPARHFNTFGIPHTHGIAARKFALHGAHASRHAGGAAAASSNPTYN